MRLFALQPGSGNEMYESAHHKHPVCAQPSDVQHHQRNSTVLALGLPVLSRVWNYTMQHSRSPCPSRT